MAPALVSLLLSVAAAVPPPAPGAMVWGGDGHRLVCEIAWHRLTLSARAMVQTSRSADPDSGASFLESCLWADRVRSTTRR